MDWSLQSQAIHGLKWSYIEEHDIPAHQVYAEMIGRLIGHQVIYSDTPEWEGLWLRRLGVFKLRVADIGELIGKYQRDGFSSELANTFASNNLTQHRADHDALAIA